MSENTIMQILSRRSIRKFKNEPVREGVLNNILEAGRCSPSATNVQPWHFVIARNQKAKEACTYRGFNMFAMDASFVVVGLQAVRGNYGEAFLDGCNCSPSKHGGCSLGSRCGVMLDGCF